MIETEAYENFSTCDAHMGKHVGKCGGLFLYVGRLQESGPIWTRSVREKAISLTLNEIFQNEKESGLSLIHI